MSVLPADIIRPLHPEVLMTINGRVEVFDRFFPHDMMEKFFFPSDMMGMDLTSYEAELVVERSWRRRNLSQEARERYPRAILLVATESGDHIILPDDFDHSKVRFYKPDYQLEREEQRRRA